MAYKLIEIKGIGGVHAATLQSKLGINTVEELLEVGASKKGREEIAAKTDIGEGHILRWVNMADLFRIKGVAEDFSDLLEMTGVDTVKELRNRNPENLHAAMAEANTKREVSGRAPRLDEVESWIAIAKQLEPKVTH